MLLIGENLNVINRVIGKAFKEKDPDPLPRRPKGSRKKGWTGLTSIWDLPERAARS